MIRFLKKITKTPSEIVIKVVGIANHFLDLVPKVRYHPILQENINHDIPWGFFDVVVGGELV